MTTNCFREILETLQDCSAIQALAPSWRRSLAEGWAVHRHPTPSNACVGRPCSRPPLDSAVASNTTFEYYRAGGRAAAPLRRAERRGAVMRIFTARRKKVRSDLRVAHAHAHTLCAQGGILRDPHMFRLHSEGDLRERRQRPNLQTARSPQTLYSAASPHNGVFFPPFIATREPRIKYIYVCGVF